MRSSPTPDHDTLREACIAAANRQGLTAYAIAKATGGNVGEDQVRRFLTRRAPTPMGSDKLQHVLRALNLEVQEMRV